MFLPQTVLRASFSIPDTLFLMVLALVVFGPRKLPEIGRQIGKLMYEFRKASNDFKLQIDEELRAAEEADRQKKLEQERQAALSLTAAPPGAAPAPVPEVATQETAALTVPAEPTTPTILPPSEGEQVSAAKPNFASPAAAAANESSEVAQPSTTAEQPVLQSGEASPNHG